MGANQGKNIARTRLARPSLYLSCVVINQSSQSNKPCTSPRVAIHLPVHRLHHRDRIVITSLFDLVSEITLER
jgi:hypothetical protein